MTSVRFYLHDQPGLLPKLDIACRLLSKIYVGDRRAYVLMNNDKEITQLDEAFWVYEPVAFVPHALPEDDEEVRREVPVLIGIDAPPDDGRDTLMNVSDKMPEGYQRFEQVLEIVDAGKAAREAARKRYQTYRDTGCEMLAKYEESEIRSSHLRDLASPVPKIN